MFQKFNSGITSFLQLCRKQTNKSHPMNPSAAKFIQKRSCQFASNISDDALTSPYILIAKQLFNPKDVIFQAAVHYLCTIADVKPKYKQPILNILKAYVKDYQNNTPRISYLNQTIKKHKL